MFVIIVILKDLISVKFDGFCIKFRG
jgi:hypothetical protein